MLSADSLGVTDVRLAHLEEPSPAREQAERRIDEPAGERIEDDVHPGAVRRLQKRVREARVPRGGDVGVVEPHRAQHVPLARARRREHLRSKMARKLHRRHADATRPSVHQDPLARLQRPQAPEAVKRGEKHQGDRGGFNE